MHMRNPKVIELAALLGRKAGSVSNKLGNLARHDPALQARGIQGLTHGAKGEDEIWTEFVAQPEALAYESARLLAQRLNKPIERVEDINEDELPGEGRERETLLRVRVNQSFFRRRILSAYNYQCCITGLSLHELLVASHIAPWSEDARNRLNPRNGLCLNALHDRAFDRHLMWIDSDLRVRFTKRLKEADKNSNATFDWLISFEGRQLILPKRFSPDPELLLSHAKRCV
ncbi:MAG: HNH endonuclease [Chloroflexi bacterium]|nr:HNH endonuclease [Chloroflexota bacterium]